MRYNWQQKDWPHFSYKLSEIEEEIYRFTELLGRSTGMLETLAEPNRLDAIISSMVAEAVKTSHIEGEYISRQDVVSSIRNKMGLSKPLEKVNDLRATGVVEMMLDVRETYAKPLSRQKLFIWHSMLMSGNDQVSKGQWRTHKEPMQVVSGALGKEKVHFEAPPSGKVSEEMQKFINWFNETAPNSKQELKPGVLRSAVAHLYFESIHPFEDGNGRIGRAISEKAIAQAAGRPVLMSLSQVIESDKKAYYSALGKAQQSNEITAWIKYFVNAAIEAQQKAGDLISFTVEKARFFDQYGPELNQRQLKVVRKMLEPGPEAFEGGMNARKYVSIAKTSKATATRDLQDLVKKAVLVPVGAGRSTRYELKL